MLSLLVVVFCSLLSPGHSRQPQIPPETLPPQPWGGQRYPPGKFQSGRSSDFVLVLEIIEITIKVINTIRTTKIQDPEEKSCALTARRRAELTRTVESVSSTGSSAERVSRL